MFKLNSPESNSAGGYLQKWFEQTYFFGKKRFLIIVSTAVFKYRNPNTLKKLKSATKPSLFSSFILILIRNIVWFRSIEILINSFLCVEFFIFLLSNVDNFFGCIGALKNWKCQKSSLKFFCNHQSHISPRNHLKTFFVSSTRKFPSKNVFEWFYEWGFS